jgi:hypothetical protein
MVFSFYGATPLTWSSFWKSSLLLPKLDDGKTFTMNFLFFVLILELYWSSSSYKLSGGALFPKVSTRLFVKQVDRPKPLKLPDKFQSLSPIQQLQYPIEALKYRVKKFPRLGSRIEVSLKIAQEKARKSLNSNLFAALEWPLSIKDYYSYLERFIRFVPHQFRLLVPDSPILSAAPTKVIANAWKRPGEEYQEILDRFAHFCFLLDHSPYNQSIAVPTKITEESLWFRDWISTILPNWGNFLDTTESFSYSQLVAYLMQKQQILLNSRNTTSRAIESVFSKEKDAEMIKFFQKTHLPHSLSSQYHSENDPFFNGGQVSPPLDPNKEQLRYFYSKSNHPSGWLTLNQFLGREINPYHSTHHEFMNNGVFNAPLDCTLQEKYISNDFHIYPQCQLYGNSFNSPLRADERSPSHNFDHMKKVCFPLKYESRKDLHSATMGHYSINPYHSHVLYSPMNGFVKENQLFQEKLFFDVLIRGTPLTKKGVNHDGTGTFELTPSNLKQFPNRGYPFYFMKNVLIIDTVKHSAGDVGPVVLVTLGLGGQGFSGLNIVPLPESHLLKGQKIGTVGFSCLNYFLLFANVAKPILDGVDTSSSATTVSKKLRGKGLGLKEFKSGVAMGTLLTKRKVKSYYQF